MKILIFCPAYRIEPETIDAIFHQDYEGNYEVVFTRDNPYGHHGLRRGYMNVAWNYNKLRNLFRQQGYDAAWIVESDIVPPPDALRKLLVRSGDTVGGLYILRQEQYPLPAAFRRGFAPDITTTLRWDEIKANWGKVIETSGTCMGCLLIHRHIVNDLDFDFQYPGGAPDLSMMRELWRLGKKQLLDLSVICGHKRPDGTILYPTPDGVEEIWSDRTTYSQF